MKWYSVKKYKPPLTVTACFVRTEEGSLYVASNVEMQGGNYTWEAQHYELDGYEVTLSNVTHFAIPDPVEIEE